MKAFLVFGGKPPNVASLFHQVRTENKSSFKALVRGGIQTRVHRGETNCLVIMEAFLSSMIKNLKGYLVKSKSTKCKNQVSKHNLLQI